MEKEAKKAGSDDLVLGLVLLGGVLYGLHQNYLEYVKPKVKFDTNWLEIFFSTMLYTLGDVALMCLLVIDKVIYNAKFHATVLDWSRQLHPNGDMVGLGSLIVLICYGFAQIRQLLHKLNTPSS